jgi:hypothetical protein
VFSDPVAAGNGGVLARRIHDARVERSEVLRRVINAAQTSAAPNEDGVFVNPGEMTVFSPLAIDQREPTDQHLVLRAMDRAASTTNGGSLALAGDPPMITLSNHRPTACRRSASSRIDVHQP